MSDLAKELSIGTNVLYRWIKEQKQRAPLGSGGPGAEGDRTEADERRALRREIAQLKLENDILKKAAVLLGTQTLSGSAR